jgi:hypothetical protein
MTRPAAIPPKTARVELGFIVPAVPTRFISKDHDETESYCLEVFHRVIVLLVF